MSPDNYLNSLIREQKLIFMFLFLCKNLKKNYEYQIIKQPEILMRNQISD